MWQMQPSVPPPGAQWLEPPRRKDQNSLEQTLDSPAGTKWKQLPPQLSAELALLLTDASNPDVCVLGVMLGVAST